MVLRSVYANEQGEQETSYEYRFLRFFLATVHPVLKRKTCPNPQEQQIHS